MLFERSSKVAGFDPDMLARIANKADIGAVLLGNR
jgi:hypothetical protein